MTRETGADAFHDHWRYRRNARAVHPRMGARSPRFYPTAEALAPRRAAIWSIFPDLARRRARRHVGHGAYADHAVASYARRGWSGSSGRAFFWRADGVARGRARARRPHWYGAGGFGGRPRRAHRNRSGAVRSASGSSNSNATWPRPKPSGTRWSGSMALPITSIPRRSICAIFSLNRSVRINPQIAQDHCRPDP